MYAMTLMVAAASRLSLSYFIKRVWLFVPIFTGIVVLPATFSFITPGAHRRAARTLVRSPRRAHQPGPPLGRSHRPRVATSISFVVLLALTTTWTRLLAALRAMLVPRMFILVLGMAYRYVFHLLGSVTDMYEARKARTVQADNVVRSGRAFVSATAGTMFGKAHAMSEEVYQAMVSRGYTGQARTLSAFRVRAVDVVWLVGVRGRDRTGARGRSCYRSLNRLRRRGVSYTYLDRFPALDDVSLAVRRGEKVALLGANGAASRPCSRSSTG